MKSEYEIYMDFKRAKEQAQRLRSIANRLQSMANEEMSRTLNAVGTNWTGENSEAFLAKGNTLKGKISGTGGDLHKIANAIDRIAETTRAAEMAAIAIASD